MAELNTVEQQIVPDMPRTVDNEQLSIYVPIATTSKVGISKYNSLDFKVSLAGEVELKHAERNLIKDATPLVEPSYVKLSSDEFSVPAEVNEAYPTASLILRRDWTVNNVFNKAALIKVNTTDFINNAGTVGVAWPSDPFNSGSKLGFNFSGSYFKQSGTTIIPTLPKAHEGLALEDGYGAVKINNGYGQYLYYDATGILSFNENKLNDVDANYIRPNYTVVPSGYLQNDNRDGDKRVAVRKAYWLADTTVGDDLYYCNAEVPSAFAFDKTTMYYRTELVFNKTVVGLGNVDNVSISGTVSSHNTDALAHANLLATKLNITTHNNAISRLNDDIDTLEASLSSLTSEVSAIGNRFLGDITNPDAAAEANATYLNRIFDPTNEFYGQSTYLRLTNTNTVWRINFDTSTWYDTTVSQFAQDIEDWKATASSGVSLISDGAAAYGTANYWAPIDHVHPLRDDLFKFKLDNVARKLYINEQSVDFDNIGDLTLTVPYVPEGKYLHNWNGDFAASVPTFVQGTAENGRYMHLWSGTGAQFATQFAGSAPADVLAIITDDVNEYDGYLVDTTALATALTELKTLIVGNAETNSKYIFSPTVENPFAWTTIDTNSYLTKVLATDVNIEGEILTYKSKPLLLLTETEYTDANVNFAYHRPTDSRPNIINALGNTRGAYLTYSDLLSTVSDNAVLKNLVNTDGTYPVESTSAGAVGKIDTAIANLWTYSKAINTALVNYDIANIKIKADTYPTMPTGVSSTGLYMLSKATDEAALMTARKFASTDITANSGVITSTSVTFKNKTNETNVVNTVGNLASLLEEASKVHFYEAENSAYNGSSLKFWVGTKAQYEAIVTKDATCVYICNG